MAVSKSITLNPRDALPTLTPTPLARSVSLVGPRSQRTERNKQFYPAVSDATSTSAFPLPAPVAGQASGATYFAVPPPAAPPFKSTQRVAGPRCTRTYSTSRRGGSTRDSGASESPYSGAAPSCSISSSSPSPTRLHKRTYDLTTTRFVRGSVDSTQCPAPAPPSPFPLAVLPPPGAAPCRGCGVC